MHDMTPSRGIRNNNPGNIRKSSEPWRGLAAAKDQKDPAFFTFETPEWGIRAMAVILRTYQTKYGLRTIRAIIGRWAPSAENDTDAYVDAARGIVWACLASAALWAVVVIALSLARGAG